MSERDHRLETRRPSRRYPPGDQRHEQHQHNSAGDRRRIDRFERRTACSECSASSPIAAATPTAAPITASTAASRRIIQRTCRRSAPNARRMPISFVRRATRVRHDAVDTHACEHEGERGESGCECHEEPFLRDGRGNLLVLRADIEDRQLAVDRRDRFPDSRDDARFARRSADFEGHRADVARAAPAGRRDRTSAETASAAIHSWIGDNAYDLKRPGSVSERPAERILIREELPHESLIDDGDGL